MARARCRIGRCGLLAAAICLLAQSAAMTQAPAVIDARLGADDDAYMTRQAAALLGEASAVLDRTGPRAPEPLARRLALRLIDAVLHDAYAPARPPVQAFLHTRIERALRDIERTRVASGARIWKLYNHGFVVRTRAATIAFDLHLGARGFRLASPRDGAQVIATPGFPCPPSVADRLARQCDVLFISHRHADHADPVVARAFADRGRPIVAPDDVFAGTDLQGRVIHLARDAARVQRLPVRGGRVALRVVVCPGQQYQSGGLPNNVVIVTEPGGMTFAHDGDQIDDPYPAYQADFAWIDHVKDRRRVDALMTNVWTNDLLRIARGFNPRVVISGHENELGHPPWDRVPFWGDEAFLSLNYSQMKRAYPTVVMAWGENCTLPPARAGRVRSR